MIRQFAKGHFLIIVVIIIIIIIIINCMVIMWLTHTPHTPFLRHPKKYFFLLYFKSPVCLLFFGEVFFVCLFKGRSIFIIFLVEVEK